MSEFVLECLDIHKSYSEAGQRLQVLSGVNLQLRASERLAIVGASGSGKSTLLNVLGGLDRPCSGSVRIAGERFSELSDNKRGLIRNRRLGFVYQFHHLLPEFSALENVAMPLRIAGKKATEQESRASELLERVGLGQRLTHKPSQLSGGERQRAAIARALAMQPDCVLLDEPTGNLDKKNAENIHQLINELSAELATAFVIVTHDEHLAARLDRCLVLEDGSLQERRP
ncbi:lipoprotein-releasing ABC transporter ATP-binding protein LolD [Agaribacterium haliotis]|uniref:lipoprotein-releasing ABC transporter ATP-binding protein LolD n=1 Tax=Agaribacterium haliotis TaxID=2013869 RepID=UPI000BB5993A|nr:lipoprotein-releasing ABC transporter ATP-binding protein LolD [Agaribacterium haliotis]